MYTNILKLNYIYCTTFPTICYHIFHSHTKNFPDLSNINKKSQKTSPSHTTSSPEKPVKSMLISIILTIYLKIL